MTYLSSLIRRSRPLAAVLIAGLIALAGPGGAQAADPAVARIDAFDTALIAMMKAGPALGAKGRYRKIEPAVTEAFDLPFMTRLAVGPKWLEASAADQDALVKAFARLTTASWAHNFDHFSGERFTVDPAPKVRGPDTIVQSELIPASGAHVSLLYRMRQSGGVWKVVDVYFDGVSQVTLRRSDFVQPLAQGGAPALIAHLDSLSAKLLQ
jgi:phospholipid transport system substrate-binding protein